MIYLNIHKTNIKISINYDTIFIHTNEFIEIVLHSAQANNKNKEQLQDTRCFFTLQLAEVCEAKVEFIKFGDAIPRVVKWSLRL